MIITLANNKGGVSKTTIAQALANGMKKKGYKVLAIDLDPQGNLSYAMDAGKPPLTAYDLLEGKQAEDCITSTAQTHLIASNNHLASVQINTPDALKERLEPLKSRYDYIIIDTAPALNMLNINALTASDFVIVPATADVFSLQGLAQFAQNIVSIRDKYNPDLRIAGIAISQFNKRTILNRQLSKAMQDVAKTLNTKVFNSKIRNAVAVPEAQAMQEDIFNYDPRNRVTADLNALVNEVIKTIT